MGGRGSNKVPSPPLVVETPRDGCSRVLRRHPSPRDDVDTGPFLVGITSGMPAGAAGRRPILIRPGTADPSHKPFVPMMVIETEAVEPRRDDATDTSKLVMVTPSLMSWAKSVGPISAVVLVLKTIVSVWLVESE